MQIIGVEKGKAMEIIVNDSDLRHAAAEGMDEFISVFTDAYMRAMTTAGGFDTEAMQQLSADQNTLLAYKIFRDEMMEGGFCQLIQNGYGAYIFHNPFAKAMRLWGMADVARTVNAARRIYEANREDLERERDDEEFMAMYEQYEAFDDLETEFIENEETYTAAVATYVDEHMELFARVAGEASV